MGTILYQPKRWRFISARRNSTRMYLTSIRRVGGIGRICVGLHPLLFSSNSYSICNASMEISFVVDYRTEGCSFDVITSNGSLVTVEVHPALFSHTIQLFSLYPVSDKEITGEEREMYIQSTDLIRFSDSNALDKTIRVKEEGVKVGQYVHIRGLLVKREEDHLIVRGGQGGKLTISSHPIEEESVCSLEMIYMIYMIYNHHNFKKIDREE